MAKKNSGTALAEPEAVASNWETVSDAVTTAVAAKTNERAVVDLKRWRELIVSIADGRESPDNVVGELTDLAFRLRLQPQAIHDDVHAIQQDRDNRKLVLEQTTVSDQAVADGNAAVEEIPRLEKRLNELRGKVQLASLIPQRKALLVNESEAHVVRNPRMFADVETVAREIATHGTGAAERKPTWNYVSSSTP